MRTEEVSVLQNGVQPKFDDREPPETGLVSHWGGGVVRPDDAICSSCYAVPS